MIATTAAWATGEGVRSLVASHLARLVFVGGSPRSGTTLVQRILDCHPEIYGGPEFDFVPAIANLCRDMRSSIRTGRIDTFLDEQGLVDAFRYLVVSLFAPKLAAEAVAFLSEKTPSNVLAFPWLEEYAPEAKKILVVRDPRDVVSSMLEVARRQRSRQGKAASFVRDTVAAVDYMNQCLESGFASAETSASCLVVYYEDAIADPLGAANRMYKFIGVHELDNLDLESERFEAARDKESWIDWATPGTLSGSVVRDRVGIAKERLKQSDWDYVCAKTIRHPLITGRYALASSWTMHARYRLLACFASRIKERISVSSAVLLAQLKAAFVFGGYPETNPDRY